LVPLQLLNFGEIPLQFTYSEGRHYNSPTLGKMPHYTSLGVLGPAAVYGEFKYFRMDDIALSYFSRSTH
jgi:hypothetical protein